MTHFALKILSFGGPVNVKCTSVPGRLQYYADERRSMITIHKQRKFQYCAYTRDLIATELRGLKLLGHRKWVQLERLNS